MHNLCFHGNRPSVSDETSPANGKGAPTAVEPCRRSSTLCTELLLPFFFPVVRIDKVSS